MDNAPTIFLAPGTDPGTIDFTIFPLGQTVFISDLDVPTRIRLTALLHRHARQFGLLVYRRGDRKGVTFYFTDPAGKFGPKSRGRPEGDIALMLRALDHGEHADLQEDAVSNVPSLRATVYRAGKRMFRTFGIKHLKDEGIYRITRTDPRHG